MKVKFRITFKQYAKLLLELTYKKPVMILILCVDLVMILWVVFYYTGLVKLPKPTFYQFTTIGLISIVQPIVIYTTIWKNYHSSGHLKEPLEVEFDRRQLKITGDSFYTELNWAKIFKVKELTNWFLIYQNNLSAVIVPRHSLQPQQATQLIELVKSIPGLKSELKNDRTPG